MGLSDEDAVVIKSALESLGIAHQRTPDAVLASFRVPADRAYDMYIMIIDVGNGVFRCRATCRYRVALAARPTICRLLTFVNLALTEGTVELDVRDGEVILRLSTPSCSSAAMVTLCRHFVFILSCTFEPLMALVCTVADCAGDAALCSNKRLSEGALRLADAVRVRHVFLQRQTCSTCLQILLRQMPQFKG